MNEDVIEEEKKGYRLIFSKLATLPTQHLSLVGKIMAMLIARGQVLVPLLEKALADAMPKQSVLPPLPAVDIEGEYEIPELVGGVIDLGNLPDVTPDKDYKNWELGSRPSEPSPKTRVVIAKSQDGINLNRLICPSDPVENYLTQAQVDFLARLLKDKIAKVTKGGLFFFFHTGVSPLTYEYFSLKIIGINSLGKLRFAVRRGDNPDNSTVALPDAYVVRIQQMEVNNE